MTSYLPAHILALLCPACLGHGGSPIEIPADDFGTEAHTELDPCGTCHGAGTSAAVQRTYEDLEGLRETVAHQDEMMRAVETRVEVALAALVSEAGQAVEIAEEELREAHRLLSPGDYVTE